MVCVTIPCPRCGRFVDVMAHEGTWRQMVGLPSHKAPDGTDCSKDWLVLPRIPTDREMEYMDRALMLETISPHEKLDHPPAPRSAAPMIERLGQYARVCPFSSLLRLYLDVEEACDALFRITYVFDPNPVDESDHFETRLEDVEEALGDALADRLRNGLQNLHVDPAERTISFRDPASGESIEVSLTALRVTPSAFSPFRPGELPDEPDEDEAGDDDED